MNVDKLRGLLRKEVVEIHFIKKNGDDRVMMATTAPDYLPVGDTDGRVETTPHETILTVWDIEADGWRSVRFESIIYVEWDEDDGTIGKWKPE